MLIGPDGVIRMTYTGAHPPLAEIRTRVAALLENTLLGSQKPRHAAVHVALEQAIEALDVGGA